MPFDVPFQGRTVHCTIRVCCTIQYSTVHQLGVRAQYGTFCLVFVPHKTKASSTALNWRYFQDRWLVSWYTDTAENKESLLLKYSTIYCIYFLSRSKRLQSGQLVIFCK